MKSLKNYLLESEFAINNPVPGDVFEFELSTDTLIETVVAELDGCQNMGQYLKILICLLQQIRPVLLAAMHLLRIIASTIHVNGFAQM